MLVIFRSSSVKKDIVPSGVVLYTENSKCRTNCYSEWSAVVRQGELVIGLDT